MNYKELMKKNQETSLTFALLKKNQEKPLVKKFINN